MSTMLLYARRRPNCSSQGTASGSSIAGIKRNRNPPVSSAQENSSTPVPDEICFRKNAGRGVRPFRVRSDQLTGPGGMLLAQPLDGGGNSAPRRRAIVIAVGGKLVGARGPCQDNRMAREGGASRLAG